VGSLKIENIHFGKKKFSRYYNGNPELKEPGRNPGHISKENPGHAG
jgi:hypothetical protein